MLESIEGKRGLPRNRPPYIAEVGLWGRPTLNHNVETLWWIRDIVEKGPQWFAGLGKPGHPGIRSWSVSGRVKNPGVKLAPAGVTVRELIEDYCGGMEDGHTFSAYLPGGASGGILPASLGDIALDFGGELAEHGAFVGSHAIVVFSQHDSPKEATVNLLKFFRHESCGQCTPCREGRGWMWRVMERLVRGEAQKREIDMLLDVTKQVEGHTICALGDAAAWPIQGLIRHFRPEIERRIDEFTRNAHRSQPVLAAAE
jgi:formate dehydrogenase